MSPIGTGLVWVIAGGAIACVLFRPRNWPEAIWACLGAALLVLCRLLPVADAARAVAGGTDVYLFLTGMMLLAELARRYGVFDWMAALAAKAARGSAPRLFALVYGVGILVTVFLSNDATAVVLTPAVYAAVKKARANPLPYLLICAFIANAASFVLPISNPANLVVYGNSLPRLLEWLRVFLLPSIFSIAATYAALWWVTRREVCGAIEHAPEVAPLSRKGAYAAWGIAASAAVLLASSGLGLNLGLPTCLTALIAVVITTRLQGAEIRGVVEGVAWSVLPLVAGLFVIVAGLSRAGGMDALARTFEAFTASPPIERAWTTSFSLAALSNLMNNLPSGLLAGGALRASHAARLIRDSVLIGVDLGPNLSVTGSLATILWLIALRREGIEVGAWRFLKTGALVMPPALLLSVAALSWLAR